jgi:hypothetical protein
MSVTRMCGKKQSGFSMTCTFPEGHDGMHGAGGMWWRADPRDAAVKKPLVSRAEAYLNRIRGKAHSESELDRFFDNPNYGLLPSHPMWQNIKPEEDPLDVINEVLGGRCGVQGCILDPGHDTERGQANHFVPGKGYFNAKDVEWSMTTTKLQPGQPLIQALLRTPGITVASVVDKFKLKLSRSKRHPSLVQFKYDQLESDMSEQLVRECRGLILDESDNWKVIARPFDKFFNAQEGMAAKIDWDTARVVEKLDGSCCILYYYKGGWHVATLGSCDASGECLGFPGMTFADLFWMVFQDSKYKLPDTAWQDVTFIFELTSPWNRVVVQHATSQLHLIGTRHVNGEESSVLGTKDGKGHGYNTPKSFPLKTLKDIEATFEKLDPLITEGYVVVDGKYNRIKCKHPGYVRIHHLKDSFTLRNVVEMVRMGETPEFLAHFPEHQRIVDLVRESFFDLVDTICMIWVSARKVENTKQFAMQQLADGTLLKDLPYSGILFNLKHGKAENPLSALRNCHVDSLISWLELERPIAKAS